MDNDIHLDDSSRPMLKVEPYDGKGNRGGGNHVMSGEPLFKCPKYGLTGISYCYSCSNFNGLKKDHQGNLGDCDLYPGARQRIVAQIARNQPNLTTGKLTKQELDKMGVRNLNEEIGGVELARTVNPEFSPRSVGSINRETIKREWENSLQARSIGAVQKDFKKAVKN